MVILLIDDDETFRFIFKVYLEQMGLPIRVVETENGNDGIAALISLIEAKESSISVFLDLNLPKMDGWDILEEMDKSKTITKDNVSLYMLSSSVNPREIERAESHNLVRKFIQKPITTEILSGILNKKTVN